MAQDINFIITRQTGVNRNGKLRNLQADKIEVTTWKSTSPTTTTTTTSTTTTTTSTTTPVPPPTFLNSLAGPSNEDGPQKLSITAGTSNDKIYYNNWDGLTLGFTSTLVFVNGVERANISHTTDRVGTQFGYSISGSTPQAYGVFTNLGSVYLTI